MPNKHSIRANHPHTPPAMSTSYPNTYAAVNLDDDEDNDICPVCEGECTCSQPQQRDTPVQPVASSSSTTLSDFHRPVLKIKLKLPTRAQDYGSITPTHNTPIPGPSQPKRRGRPPKHSAHSIRPQPHSIPVPRKKLGRPPKKGLVTGSDRYIDGSRKHKRPRTPSDRASLSPLSSLDGSDIDDSFSIQFPTFVSASALSCTESSASDDEDIILHYSDDSMGGVSDGSIEAEEEQYILKSEHRMRKTKGPGRKGKKKETEKTMNRWRRGTRHKELLSSTGGTSSRDRDKRDNFHTGNNQERFPNLDNEGQGDWIIRPRRTSFGDVKMEDASESSVSGSGSTSGSETDDEDEDADDDADEMDSKIDDEEATLSGSTRTFNKRLATTWSVYSDSEESSFDADLFFANLTSSSSSEDGESDSSCDEGCMAAGIDGDHSDLDGETIASPTSRQHSLFGDAQAEVLPAAFEITERWDGRIEFSNGQDTMFEEELDFESLVLATPLPPRSQQSLDLGYGFPTIEEEDVDMPYAATDPPETSVSRSQSPHSASGSDEELEDTGGTTDEDLVDLQSHLPNDRAMALFASPYKLPVHLQSLSGIDPLSTLSPSRGRGRGRRVRRSDPVMPLSPSPADILASHWAQQQFEDDSDFDDVDMSVQLDRESSTSEDSPPLTVKSRTKAGLPVTREFLVPALPQGSVPDIKGPMVIDGAKRVLPSPYAGIRKARSGRRDDRRRTVRIGHGSAASLDGIMSLFPKFSAHARTSSLPPGAPPSFISDSQLSDLGGLHQSIESLGGLSTAGSDAPEWTSTTTTPPSLQIHLEDVLDPAILNAEPDEDYPLGDSFVHESLTSETPTSDGEGSMKYFDNLNRWDLIPVGAFKQTTDTLSDIEGPNMQDYLGVIRASPFDLLSSPFPASPQSGFATPKPKPSTNAQPQKGHKHKHKQRDRKVNRKNFGGEGPRRYQSPQRSYHQHYHHQHHPNSKSRSFSAAQRASSNNSPTSNT